MTSLLSAKKRAEEFAAAVEGGADRSALRPEMAELVAVAATLQREAPPVPRAEFTAALRERLMTEAAASFAEDKVLALPPRRKGSRERRIALVASSLVLVGGTAGMAAAAQNALPGEALYPIKRGLEKAQTGLSTNDADRGQDLLAQADSRLVEVQGLFDRSAGLSQVPGTIDDFTTQAIEASDVLLDEYEKSGDASLIEELSAFAADNLDELQRLAKTAPPEAQDELAIAADALMQIAARAEAVCPDCSAQLASLEMPTLFLTANEARKAMDAAERAEIDNSHPPIAGDRTPEPRKGDRNKGDEPAPTKGGDDTTKSGDDTGSTGGTGTTGGDDPAAPDLPTEGVDIGGPSTGGTELGEKLDEVTKGGAVGGGKNTEAGQLQKSIPAPIDDVIDVVVP